MEYPNFTKESKSLVAKHITKEVYESLKDKKTKNGFTLDQAIRSGVENPDSSIGVYAGDEESYEVFAPLFDKIIEEYHGFSKNDKHQSNLDINDLKISNPDIKNKYIISTRIRVGRNLANIPLGTSISKKQRLEVERKVSDTLNALGGDLAGKYYPLEGMGEDDKQTLIKEHFLFKEGDRFLKSAGLNRHWPSARGIYHNHNKTFLVWINEEDQLRIISMQKGGNIKEVFARLVKALNRLEEKMKFAYNEHLGYISSCPTNLGTAMRASVHIKLPKLAQNMELFNKITQEHHLQIRGIDGEHSKSKGGIYDISNKRRLGITEIECVEDLYNGVVALINEEEKL
ncbi:MAG: arginine kinase [Proteobacteria bacterium]|nr:MAG: arginine kinase [Pseudomonadota bacterium]